MSEHQPECCPGEPAGAERDCGNCAMEHTCDAADATPFPCADWQPAVCELARLRGENVALRQIAADLHWMARRYADGRRSYAVGMFNRHTLALLKMNVSLNATGDGTIWARSGYGRGHDGLTIAEAAAGREPDWWHQDLAADDALLLALAVLHPGDAEARRRALPVAERVARERPDGEEGADAPPGS